MSGRDFEQTLGAVAVGGTLRMLTLEDMRRLSGGHNDVSMGQQDSHSMYTDSLFRELKSDVERLADPLFKASRRFVKARGMFLPHGAVLTVEDEVRLVMAVPPDEERPVSALEIMPLLRPALRRMAESQSVRAVAVCEDVRITVEGKKQTAAIKVLLEHRRGLCAALYMPFRTYMFWGYWFGDIFVQPANPEVVPWRISHR